LTGPAVVCGPYVQSELVLGLSVTHSLRLFSRVPLSVVKSAECRSSLMQRLVELCSDVMHQFTPSTSTYTVAQLMQLVGKKVKLGYIIVRSKA